MCEWMAQGEYTFWLRKCITDYAFAAGIIFYTGFVHIPGHIKETGIEFLQVTRTYPCLSGMHAHRRPAELKEAPENM
ncbi:BQ2448_1516 [Microbotryum intermedium]|uniref:BQ2448_1516 protein n=1 Tax=Microbotryum intermedium TaxID=269621 RepID=A0A238F8C7_9BASI|nr:BQ2448_1516 [Microbotryum intermedium]